MTSISTSRSSNTVRKSEAQIIVSRATLLPVYDGVDEVYYAHTLQLSRISKRAVLPERPRCPRKSDTARAVCKSNPEHGVCSPVQYSAPPSVHRLPFPAVSSPLPPLLSPYTRARAYAHLFNVQKAECTREKYSHYIALVRTGPIAGSRFYRVYTGTACPNGKGYDVCKHTCSRAVIAGPVDSTEFIYRQSYADIYIKGHDVNRLTERKIYTVLVRRYKIIGQSSNIGVIRDSIYSNIEKCPFVGDEAEDGE